MRIEDRFTVNLPIEEAWKVLLDVERIAPCMPGAQLQEVAGDEYRGIVKVKLGAITAQYKGAVRIAEADEAGRRIVLRAEGRETKGQGNASANVVATLVAAAGGGTKVAIETDLTITGRIAQFGRGVMADVSAKLLGDFARCLEEDLAGAASAGGAGTGVGGGSGAGEPGGEAGAGGSGGEAGAGGGRREAGAGQVSAGSGAAGAGRLAGSGDVEAGAPLGEAVPAGAPPGEAVPAGAPQGEAVPAPRLVTPAREPEPLNLLAVAGPSVFQRVMPAAILGVLLALIGVKGKGKRSLLSMVGAALVVAQASTARRS